MGKLKKLKQLINKGLKKKKKKSLKELRDEDTFGSGPRPVRGSVYNNNPFTGRKTKFNRRKKLQTKKSLRKSRDRPT